MDGITSRKTGDAGTAGGTGTVGKALTVLDIVADSEVPLRFTDVLALSGQPRGTLHRQISHLLEEGLLVVNRDQTYALGLRLLRWATRAWASNQFRAIAEPHLRRLHDVTGETVHLGVLNGREVVYLDKVEGRQAVRMHSHIGNASPSYCTGVGKAALSALSDETIRRLLADVTFRRFTDTTLPDLDALVAEVGDIRASGNAFDREEHEAGIRCVAAPISSPERGLVGGVSVTAPAYRVSMDDLEGWAGDVRAAADAITEEIGLRMGPRA